MAELALTLEYLSNHGNGSVLQDRLPCPLLNSDSFGHCFKCVGTLICDPLGSHKGVRILAENRPIERPPVRRVSQPVSAVPSHPTNRLEPACQPKPVIILMEGGYKKFHSVSIIHCVHDMSA